MWHLLPKTPLSLGFQKVRENFLHLEALPAAPDRHHRVTRCGTESLSMGCCFVVVNDGLKRRRISHQSVLHSQWRLQILSLPVLKKKFTTGV
jgi:hypothetical protein